MSSSAPNDQLTTFHKNPAQHLLGYAAPSSISDKGLAHALLSAAVPKGEIVSEVPTSLLLGVAGRLWKVSNRIAELEGQVERMKNPTYLKEAEPIVIYVDASTNPFINPGWIEYMELHTELTRNDILQSAVQFFHDNVLNPIDNATTFWTVDVLQDNHLVKLGDIAEPVMGESSDNNGPFLNNAWLAAFEKVRHVPSNVPYYTEHVGVRYVAAKYATEKEQGVEVKIEHGSFQYQIPHYDGAPLGKEYYLPAEAK